MEMIQSVLYPLTAWHWLALALILLGVEMAAGTFDLLWISIAGFATAAFEAFAPGLAADWKVQVVFFFVASAVLVVLGRTVFAGLRRVTHEHPTLNKRMDSLVGRRGVVATAFQAGIGRVKIGDTEWSAETVDGANLYEGAGVIVEDTLGNIVKVRGA